MSETENIISNVERQKIDLASFQKAKTAMIATNDSTYSDSLLKSIERYRARLTDYTEEEIDKIIFSSDTFNKIKLSRQYFQKDGIYRQIIIYYATLLKYVGLLIPNPSYGQKLSNSHISKRYYNAMDYIEKMNLPTFLTNCALKILVDGCYYGIIIKADKDNFVTFDLPSSYCRTRFKDLQGNDIIEFDVSYFNTIIDEEVRKNALALYPAEVKKHYRAYIKGKTSTKWVIIGSESSICFPLFEVGPYFLNLIPSIIRYNKAVDLEQEREAEEIRKIIVQKIPHLEEGRLLFEPDEAEEIHSGTVGMLKGNKNISVLTTYADVDAIVSKTSNDGARNALEQMKQYVYTQSGTSDQLFASTGSSTTNLSIRKDIAFMMVLANKFSTFVTNIINSNFANGNISFRYNILNVSYQNEKDYIDESYKLANSGYIFSIPALAFGINQKELLNMKTLENDVLKLGENLIPLSSSFTQSGTGNPVGRPKLAQEDKSDKTIQNEQSLDNQALQGGSE